MLGAAGQPGLTAYVGVEHVSRAARGETVVVSGAAGAVGSVACQLFRRRGCHVIGVCGTDEKATWLTQSGACDVALNYNLPQLAQHLAHAGPAHVYWDNVGGATSDTVITSCLAHGARIVLCGQVSMYDSDEPYPPPLPPAVAQYASERGITRERYLVLRHQQHFPAALAALTRLLAAGQLQAPLALWKGGVGAAPTAFVEMLRGANLGKALVAAGEHAHFPFTRQWRLAEAVREVLPARVRGALAARLVTEAHFAAAADPHPG